MVNHEDCVRTSGTEYNANQVLPQAAAKPALARAAASRATSRGSVSQVTNSGALAEGRAGLVVALFAMGTLVARATVFLTCARHGFSLGTQGIRGAL
jgi:hypothetical protein